MKENIYQKIVPQGVVSKVALLGELGSGKTHFVKEFTSKIAPEVQKLVSSPTFSYLQVYEGQKITIHHFDLYRIEESQKLLDIGIWESLEHKAVITFIEWANLFPETLELCELQLQFSFENGQNKIKICDTPIY